METKQDKRGHGKVTGKLFAKGNKKIDKAVGVYSLPPIKTCVNCATCSKSCYAVQAYKQYPHSKHAWDYNFSLSKTDKFYTETCKQLNTRKPKKIIRLHASGDFYSQEYIDKWYNIIKDNPNTMFYGYTKNIEALKLNELDNCNIIYSFIEGYRNYGTIEYCQLLHDKFGAYICHLDESKGEKCMKECQACLTHAIVIHGTGTNHDDYESKVIDELRKLPNLK